MLLRSVHSPGAPVETVSTLLTDGQSKFGMTKTVVQARSGDVAPTRVLLLNGLFERRSTYRPLMRRLAATALKQGQGLEIVAYDDPCVGSSAYGQAYRTERASQIVRHLTNQSDNKLTLAGHSRGNVSAVDLAPAAIKDGRINRIVSVGGVGYTPQQAGEFKVSEVLMRAGRELSARGNRGPGVRSARAVGRLVGDGVVHVLGNYGQACDEVRTILATDKINHTLDLMSDVPVEVVALDNDVFCPGVSTHANLMAAANLRGSEVPPITHLDSTHAGPLLDPQFTSQLYNVMCSTQESMVTL